MKYTIEELRSYLNATNEVISGFFLGAKKEHRENKEKLKTNEFSELCRDLMLCAHQYSGHGISTPGIPFDYDHCLTIMPLGALCTVIGVVAASPNLPEQKMAQEFVADFFASDSMQEAISLAQKGYQARFESIGFSTWNRIDNKFTKAAAGHMLASKYSSLYDAEFCMQNIDELSHFFERLEKTRDLSPQWNDWAPTFKDRFSQIADSKDYSIGRKDPSIAKILRLTRDGADLVSASDCVEATKAVFKGLVETDRTTHEGFVKSLDILDDHSSFYEVAFQSEFFSLNRAASFIDRGFQYHSTEGRINFAKNLQALIPRLQGRVADPKIVLAGFLLGGSVIDAMTLKDRAQGNPLWLEHAILDRARDPRSLGNPGSSLSTVLNILLKDVDKAEQKAFWDARPERGFHRPAEESEDFSR